ncbi:unnamed protein product [Thlaspi arvense]|uniref:Uncharacterized protein n=1 Tax=Thlaspi arvense TaxID=13288 RepID=A0AAU9SU20_THLAR|nr:unnamed protein product [Thlaspi arvense]
MITITVGAAAAGAAITASQNPRHPILGWISSEHSSLLPWGSITLADASSESIVESKTGFSFSITIEDSQRLVGVGLRKKSLLGLKNIDIYAFGGQDRVDHWSCGRKAVDNDSVYDTIIEVVDTVLWT